MEENRSSNKEENLLWTGGWDSTFRLLQLLLVEKRTVRPFYIIDRERKSAGLEVYTMNQIGNKIIAKHPESAHMLLPITYINKDQIEASPEITHAWNELNQIFHVGTQYEWLPRYCKQIDIDRMEISLFSHQNMEDESDFRKHYTEFFLTRQNNKENRLDEFIRERFNILFKRIDSPIIQMTKPEMQARATANQWMDIMKMTRFCHRPGVNIKPCGVCKPCNLALQDGMTWRIPFSGRINRFIYQCKVTIKHKFLGI